MRLLACKLTFIGGNPLPVLCTGTDERQSSAITDHCTDKRLMRRSDTKSERAFVVVDRRFARSSGALQ